MYDCGEQVDQVKFTFDCWPNCREIEYCLNSRRINNCFACVGLKDKKYCILNKQYSKEKYYKMIEKIKEHMNEMPFTDKKGNFYKYGEYFPIEFSPFAYNETIINDEFPLNKEEAEKLGFVWRDFNRRKYESTIIVSSIPESILEVNENIIKETIECLGCKKAYRITLDELQFLKTLNLPIPRYCVDCRFTRRQNFMVPPLLKDGSCMCSGEYSLNGIYKNTQIHDVHGKEKCLNIFKTAYDIDKEIIYCEKCYQQEVY